MKNKLFLELFHGTNLFSKRIMSLLTCVLHDNFKNDVCPKQSRGIDLMLV